MQLADFIATHVPALATDELRHNVLLWLLQRAEQNQPLMTWTLGQPGACALMTPDGQILLGDLTRAQSRQLAEATRDLRYGGVVGLEQAPRWFVERASELGITFDCAHPQRLHALYGVPRMPDVAGSTRTAIAEDGPLLADWLEMFRDEAVPHDPAPARATLEKVAAGGRHTLWVVDGAPVSVAGIARRLQSVVAIAPVFTPPSLRGRGYAAAVTAVLAQRLLAEGKAAVCLFTDLRNAASNRCYAKIGFKGVYDGLLYLRRS